MNISIHQRIRVLIEETNDAYASCGTMNADFAEFAAMAITEFKSILGDPDLTGERLIEILRLAMNKHHDKDSVSWSIFVANHIANTANRNGRTPFIQQAWPRNRMLEAGQRP
jgi:hypothetical protein